MAEPYDRWHKSRPKPGEAQCKAHGKVPSAEHGRGKRWLARWRDPDGNQENESFERFDDARKHLTKVEASIDEGTYIPPSSAEVKLKVVATAWLKNRAFKSPRTYAQYESRIENHIIAVVGEIELYKFKPSSIVAWINGRREVGLDETTIGLILAHLSAIFEQAVDDDLIRKNPCRAKSVRDVKPKRAKRPAKKVPVSAQQSDALREHLPDRYKATVDVGRGLGLRQGEIFGFSPNDIDWATKEAHIRTQVTHDRGVLVFAPPKCSDIDEERDRYVPVPDELLFRLTAHMSEFPPVEVTLPWKTKDGEPRTVLLLFTTREHKPLNKNYFNWLWKHALEMIGAIKAINDRPVGKGRRWEACRDKMMHALRHLYASERLDEGMSIFALALRLGHADPAYTLRRYVHEHDSDHEAERQLVSRALQRSVVPRSAPDVHP